MAKNDSGHYELRTGYTYKVVRVLPDDYQGVLPWKMIFFDNSDALVRTAVSGYTAVDRGSRVDIQVLQLMSDRKASNGKTLWNLESDSDVKSLLSGIREFKVKTPSPEKKIVELSGGNQQKCIVARGIATNPKVLILDEPTKGIDVGAKSEFYNMICQFAKQGLGVILISSEMPEVMGLSDRILVMKSLKIVGEVSREEATEDRLLSLGMMGEESYE